MKLYGKAETVAQQIITAFEEGTIPKALAQLFIHREVDCPAAEWSWRNRLLVALGGPYDARDYRHRCQPFLRGGATPFFSGLGEGNRLAMISSGMGYNHSISEYGRLRRSRLEGPRAPAAREVLPPRRPDYLQIQCEIWQFRIAAH
jgi:hypothetical protein